MSEIRVNRIVNAEGSGASALPYGLSVSAGIGITGDGGINVGGPSTIASSGGITTCGGDIFAGDSIGVLKDINVGAAATISGTTESTSSTTGAITAAGGVGIAKDLFVGDAIDVTKDLKVGAAATITGALTGSTGTFSGAVNVDATTDSTSSSTGPLIVDGGLGVAKNVYIGAGLSVAGTLTYEDVTSVDSVGLITAKSGVNITGGELTVGSGITMGIAGVATFSGTSDIHLHDNVQLNVGDASDLVIKHDGSHSRIQDTGTGYLILNTNTGVLIKNGADDENIAIFSPDGACELNYNATKKFETTNDGTVTTGIATASAGVFNSNDANAAQITGSNDAKLLLTGSTSPYITFQEASSNKAYLQWNASGYLSFQNVEDGARLRIKDDIDFSSDNGSSFTSVIHAGNVGSGGALSSTNVYVAKIIGDGSSLTGVGGDMDITSCLFV